jgi:thiamine biosynthesis lipoprotein
MTRAAAWLVATVLTRALAVQALPVTEVHYVMGTYFRITAHHGDQSVARTAMRRCFTTARQLEARFSRVDPDSELSRLNANARQAGAVEVSAEMAALLRRAGELRTATRGRFDVTVGALTELWRSTSTWPTGEAIAAARRGTGDAVHLTGTTLLRPLGAIIDLDGIAKGWAIDYCVAQLHADGIQSALLSLGESSLYALGAPPGAAYWFVALRGIDPDSMLGTLALRDEAVSVSAVFGHERRIGSRRVGHIVDPRSGLPLTTPALAVVVADSATDAEAFSKAVLIEDAVDRWPGAGRYIRGALIVRRDGLQRSGHVAFTPFEIEQRLPASVEPLG